MHFIIDERGTMGYDTYMNKKPMKKRSFRCDDELWQQIVDFVKPESTSSLIRHILRDWFKDMGSTKWGYEKILWHTHNLQIILILNLQLALSEYVSE